MKAKVIKTGEMVDVYHEPQHGQVTNIYKESVLVNGRMWSEDELDFCIKVNEAPEKIYLQVCGSCEQKYCDTCEFEKLEDDITWSKDKIFPNDVEYIRTDVFIEKACEWLRNNCTYTHPRKGTEKCAVNIPRFKNDLISEE